MQNTTEKDCYIKIDYKEYFTAYEISQILLGIDELIKEARTNTTSDAYNAELPEYLQIEIEKSSLKIIPKPKELAKTIAVVTAFSISLNLSVNRLSEKELLGSLKIADSFKNNVVNFCINNCGNKIVYDNKDIKKRSEALGLERQRRTNKIIQPQHKPLESVHIKISRGSFTSKTINNKGKIKNGAGIKIESGIFLDTEFKDRDVKIKFSPPKKSEIESKFAAIKINDAHNYTLFVDGFIVLAGDDGRPIAFEITNLMKIEQNN